MKVPGDSGLTVIVEKNVQDGSEMVFFDPDGLKAELDTYKDETSRLRGSNYDLRIKNQVLRNERKKLLKKIELRFGT